MTIDRLISGRGGSSPAAGSGVFAQKGFTLVELLLVLVIFSLAVALVGPSLTSGLTGVKQKSTARKIASALKYARNNALRERTNYYAETTGGAFVIVADQSRSPARRIAVPDDVTVKPLHAPVIVFYPAGGSSGGSVVVGDKDNRPLYTVRVEPSTGGVSVDTL